MTNPEPTGPPAVLRQLVRWVFAFADIILVIIVETQYSQSFDPTPPQRVPAAHLILIPCLRMVRLTCACLRPSSARIARCLSP